MKLQFITTSDGSHTLYLPELDEQYHSTNGAFTESNHVFIDNGYSFCKKPNPTVFEVGFGTGLNCLLTALLAEKLKRPTKFLTLEKYPLQNEIISKLNYGKIISPNAEKLFKEIHNLKWNELLEVSPYFKLKKIETDLVCNEINEVENCDVIYFDAFGPEKQPEMWTPNIFDKIYSRTSPGGIFVTYSAKGVVRRQLAHCGYDMERLPGPPGKFQMLRGIKKDSVI